MPPREREREKMGASILAGRKFFGRGNLIIQVLPKAERRGGLAKRRRPSRALCLCFYLRVSKSAIPALLNAEISLREGLQV